MCADLTVKRFEKISLNYAIFLSVIRVNLIIVPLWLFIIYLVFSYLFKVLFSGFLKFKGNFVDGINNSKSVT